MRGSFRDEQKMLYEVHPTYVKSNIFYIVGCTEYNEKGDIHDIHIVCNGKVKQQVYDRDF